MCKQNSLVWKMKFLNLRGRKLVISAVVGRLTTAVRKIVFHAKTRKKQSRKVLLGALFSFFATLRESLPGTCGHLTNMLPLYFIVAQFYR